MQDLTQGPVSRNLLRMSTFMLVGMVFQTLYFLVDLYFVGRLGKDAVAAVNLSGSLTFVVLALTQTLGVGTTALVAHATGRKDRDAVQLVFNQSQVLSLLVGGGFLLIMTLLRGPFTAGLSAEPATAALARDYLDWYVPAMALQFAMVASGAALRGTGNFKPGMFVQSGSLLVNIVLAPVLTLGWGLAPLGLRPLGVAGAGLATFIAVLAAVVGLVVYVARMERYLAFSAAALRPKPAMWGRMLKVGLPAGAEFALMGFYMMVIYAIIRPFGAAAQAGFGIGLRVVQALFMPVVALGFAVSPVAGQNFGARLPDRVRETFWVGVKLSTALMLVFTVICHLFPGPMIAMFSRDPAVLEVGTEYLRLISYNFIASGIVFVSSSMFQALGNTIPALLSSVLRVVLLVVPAYALSTRPGFQLRWIWYLSVGSVLAQVTASLLLLRWQLRLRLAGHSSLPASTMLPTVK
jgi:putative MATE family efflux protein